MLAAYKIRQQSDGEGGGWFGVQHTSKREASNVSPQWFSKQSVRDVEELLCEYKDYYYKLERTQAGLVSVLSDMPSAHGSFNTSPTERDAIRRGSCPDHILIIHREKGKLKIAQRIILERKYFLAQYDYQIIDDLKITEHIYWQVRHQIILFFANAFGIKIE